MSVCHCGIAFVEKNGVRWCRHCDEPCPHKASQRLIDEATEDGDCATLQDKFDVADHAGFLDQMKYIDEALRAAGCY